MRQVQISMSILLAILAGSTLNAMAAAACPETSSGCTCHTAAAPTALNLDLVAMTKQLNLSAEQVAKIKTILDDMVTPMAAYRDNMADNKEKMYVLNHSEPVDTAAIEVLANKQAQIITRVLAIRSQVRADIEAVLTPEQLAQVSGSHSTDTAK